MMFRTGDINMTTVVFVFDFKHWYYFLESTSFALNWIIMLFWFIIMIIHIFRKNTYKHFLKLFLGILDSFRQTVYCLWFICFLHKFDTPYKHTVENFHLWYKHWHVINIVLWHINLKRVTTTYFIYPLIHKLLSNLIEKNLFFHSSQQGSDNSAERWWNMPESSHLIYVVLVLKDIFIHTCQITAKLYRPQIIVTACNWPTPQMMEQIIINMSIGKHELDMSCKVMYVLKPSRS